MAGLLPSFLSAAQLEIRIGDKVLAYCQNLSWTDDMTTTPVGGIGAYSFHALEPVGYIGRGSMAITHFSSLAMNRNAATENNALPANLAGKTANTTRDGNSLMVQQFFSPAEILVSRTFDVNIYERRDPNGSLDENTHIYTLKNCRMTNLSMTFTPGTLVNQVVSFLCMHVVDLTMEDNFKAENQATGG